MFSADQIADPLFVLVHDPAQADRLEISQFLTMETQHTGTRANLPYTSAGSKLTDWETFCARYYTNGNGKLPFLRDVFLLLLLGVS
jgi:hypothetical protein